MAAAPLLTAKQIQRLTRLCDQYFKVSCAPINIDDIVALIHPNATCYGLKGKDNYVQGFIAHHKKYPNVRYEVLDHKTGIDNIGQWVECDFIRYWDDKETGKEMTANSKEEDGGFAERLRFDDDDFITEITKYSFKDGYPVKNKNEL